MKILEEREVNDADEMFSFLQDLLVNQVFGEIGVAYMEHKECGQLIKVVVIQRELSDNSTVTDIKLIFDGDE